MRRVLHIVGNMNMGGTETYLMNIYRNVDREKLQFDFVTYGRIGEKDYYEDEIISLGGKVYKLPSVGAMGFGGLIKELRKLLKETHYDAVHAHTMYNSGFAMIAAKKEKVPIRVVHSHTTKKDTSKSIKNKLYNGVMRSIINRNTTMCCACSKAAAEVMFTQKSIARKYKFMGNAVDFSKYYSTTEQTDAVRSELGIPDDAKVLGHVGRFGKSKNHAFAVDVFKAYTEKYDKDAYMIFVGGGDQKVRTATEEKVKTLGLSDKVIFTGVRGDVPAVMGAMDIFVFPSIYEGLGIVLLEAQAAGLNCVVSENIQPEADLGIGMLHWVNLSEGAEAWADEIHRNIGTKITDKDYVKESIEKSSFRLDKVVNDFYCIYDVK
ncbi:MAG: glycosyltransferase family 1 protein [Clostridia bacterium]|nr:glycosyltransferase family 1 protein [Clostridia bacterium]